MARPRTKTIGNTTYLTIYAYPDATTGTCAFSGDPKYVTTAGDIILFKAPGSTVHVTMVIQTNCAFDPVNSIIIADTKGHKGLPGYTPNNFSGFNLTKGNTQLDFDDDNHGNKHFYYTLNFVDPNGNQFSCDPIIVNN